MRKSDLMIVVPIWMTYTFVYLNKNMLGYAAVFNLQTNLHLVGTDFNWLGSSFYLGCLAVSHVARKVYYELRLIGFHSSPFEYPASFPRLPCKTSQSQNG